jgi:hypothetical protein
VDAAVRILLLAAAGILLLSANYWFARSVYRAFVPNEFVIAPFHVVGRTDAETVSLILASQLRARLEDLLKRLKLGARRPAAQVGGSVTPGMEPVVTLFIPEQVEIPTGLLKPIDLQVSVGGVDVVGLLAWLQAKLIPPVTLSFAVSFDGDQALVFGDLGSITGRGERAVHIQTKSDFGVIADTLAYALLRARLASSQNVPISALDPSDFRILVDVLTSVERLNWEVAQKYVVDAEFAQLLSQVEELLRKVPRWQELIFLAGSIAEGAGNQVAAASYFGRLETMREEKSLTPALATLLEKRTATLGAVMPASVTADQQRFVEIVHRFGELMQLPGSDPAVTFASLDVPGVRAQWNPEKRYYQVDEASARMPGLPQYVAIMGRFFDRHYDRCFGAERQKTSVHLTFWNSFRHTLADYLIRSVPEFEGFDSDERWQSRKQPLLAFLERLEIRSGRPAVQRLALELLNRFECDWSNADLLDQILTIVRERGLVPEAVAREVAAEVPPTTVRPAP